MYCPRCKKEINNGKKFCTFCGSRLLENEKIESNIKLNTSSNSDVLDNISMVEAYVGNSYQSLRDIGFSIWYLFFGVLYALYRKMYFYSFAYLLASAIFMMVSPKMYIVLVIVMRVFVSLKFNNMYLTHVSGVVEKYRRSYPGKNRSEMLKICRYSGGVNSTNILLGMLIIGALSYTLMGDFYKNLLNNHGISTDKKKEYNNLTFTPPKVFKKESNQSGQVLYTYQTKDNYCDFEVRYMDATKNSAHQFLNTKEMYTENDKKVFSVQTINGDNWDLLTANNDKTDTKVYDYAIIKDHVLYNVTYRVFRDFNECSNYRSELIDTLKISSEVVEEK